MSHVPGARPRLGTVLLAVNLMILVLPLGGITALRLYENELLRSTETQLVMQGVVVREAFRSSYHDQAARRGDTAGPLAPGAAAPDELEESSTKGAAAAHPPDTEEPLDALLPLLDVAQAEVRPPAPEARPAGRPDPAAVAAGAALAPVLEEAGRSTLAGIRIVDAQGIVVSTSRSELGLALGHREEVARALAGERVSLLRQRISDEPPPPLQSLSRGQRYRVFVGLPVVENGQVVGAVILSRTPLDIMKALYLQRRPLLIGAAVVLAVVVVVSLATSWLIARPVRALIRQAEGVSRGEADAMTPLAAPGTRELAHLSSALSGMARKLRERADYIHTFATHVSHEFKTPLTTIRGSVELLRDHPEAMAPAERERFLANVDEAAARLQHLVGRLLAQARADVARPQGSTAVHEALESAAQRHARHLRVTVEHDPRAVGVRMAGETLDEVLSNLLDNARRHAGEGVGVHMVSRFDAAAAPPIVEIRVADEGPGISEANAVRVFTPFFTTARARGGSGLGLSIVRAIVEAHGGQVELDRAVERGATFVIRLPAAERSVA